MARLSSLFFRNAHQLLTLAGPPVPRRGRDLAELGIIEDGAVLVSGGKILAVGKTREVEGAAHRRRARPIDCRRRVVMPGLVDPHTHLVFAGNRVEDFERRIRGASYEEIAATGGGIELSARRLREASRAELVRQAGGFLRQMATHGTTTVEVKSGYGLDVENEIKILEVIRRLQRLTPLDLVPTLLAAHAIPPEYSARAGGYVEQIVKELIPAVARRRLAEFIDCFVERGAFSVPQCRRVLAAGRRCGLTPRLHAEQFHRSGGAALAVEMKAATADHLDFASGEDIRRLAGSQVVATLLPGSNFWLGLDRYPPARPLIGAGAVVALATDFNPGTSPTLNLQFILALACASLRMTPAEAISAATINAAYALGRADRLGSLVPGKQADLAVMDVEDHREIAYYFGWNRCVMTVKRGRVVWSRG